VIGTLGELHPAVQNRYELERPAYCFELDFEALVRLSGKRRAIVPPSRYPDSVRDLALLAPLELAAEQLLSCVNGLRLKELEDVDVFDLYQGEKIPSGLAPEGGGYPGEKIGCDTAINSCGCPNHVL